MQQVKQHWGGQAGSQAGEDLRGSPPGEEEDVNHPAPKEGQLFGSFGTSSVKSSHSDLDHVDPLVFQIIFEFLKLLEEEEEDVNHPAPKEGQLGSVVNF